MNKTIWLARLLYSHTGGLTRQEIRDKWREQDDMGRPMASSTFYDNCNYLESRYGLHVRREGNRYRLECLSASEENVLRHMFGDMAADLGQDNRPAGAEWLPLMAEAIDGNSVLRMTYAPCGKTPYETDFAPYFMRRIQGRHYVVGRSSRHSSVRTFAADRIDSLVMMAQKFRRPAGITPEGWFAHSYGAYGGYDLEPVHVVADVLTQDLAAYLRGRPLHPSQSLTPAAGGSGAAARLELDIAPTRDFTGALLSFGGNLRVTQPESLRRQIAGEVRAMNRLYAENDNSTGL